MKFKKKFFSNNSLRLVKDEEENNPLIIFGVKSINQWFNSKHQNASKDEINFINSHKKETCPFCGNKNIYKCGFNKTHLQRYYCKKCLKYFNQLTGTIFDSRKISLKDWNQFLLHLFSYHSIKTSSYFNRNSKSTGFYWLNKVFMVLDDYQKNILLKGKVYIDEKLFNVNKDAIITKEGKLLRGNSRNKISVCCGVDSDSAILISAGRGKLTFKKCWNSYGQHILKGSILIHDEEKSHSILVKDLNLKSKSYNSKKLKKLPDEINPLYPINRMHALITQFFSNHKRFNKNRLQDWLNLFSFIYNPPRNKYEKLFLFYKIAFSKQKSLKYRKLYPKNSIKSNFS